ncbi:MAG TPA: MFS transporter [Pedococcus sp.]|jgi:MFS family permease
MTTERAGRPPARTRLSAWRVVVAFGLVSMAADVVYEGARSVYGPLLASLGAGAVLVGAVTGGGEAVALVLRLLFGPLADRSGRHWDYATAGYVLTVLAVPLMAFAPFAGGAGLALAVVLVLVERLGKAVRSPSKSALLAHVAKAVGRGRGFGVHKALDQVGAFAGPLLVALVLAASGAIWPALLVLAVPGAIALALLVWTRSRVPDPSVYDPLQTPAAVPAEAVEQQRRWLAEATGRGLPREFFLFAAAASLTTAGLVTFGIISYHLVVAHVVRVPTIPILYAVGMLAEAGAALVVGSLYDRVGARVLYAIPVLVAVVPTLALSRSVPVVVGGVVLWGFAYGLQDSTVKALVADLVEARRLATAYGVFAGIQGAAATGGGALIGWLYDGSRVVLVGVVAAGQLVALALLALSLHARRGAPSTG